MKFQIPITPFAARCTALVLVSLTVSMLGQAHAAVGTWTPLAQPAPARAGHMLLLSDGTVMVQHADLPIEATTNWYRLIPDIHGDYTKGTWTSIASSRRGHMFYESFVLPDGRV